jgi:hypothetical protein
MNNNTTGRVGKGMSKMDSPFEFCPKCQGVRNTILSLGLHRSIRSNGSENEDLLFHLHCRSCNIYIRSFPVFEEKEESSEGMTGIALPQYSLYTAESIST